MAKCHVTSELLNRATENEVFQDAKLPCKMTRQLQSLAITYKKGEISTLECCKMQQKKGRIGKITGCHRDRYSELNYLHMFGAMGEAAWSTCVPWSRRCSLGQRLADWQACAEEACHKAKAIQTRVMVCNDVMVVKLYRYIMIFV